MPVQPSTFILLFSGIAFLAGLMLVARGAGRRVPGCGAGSGCDEVTSSRWARLGSVPVSWFGVVTYATMVVCAIAPSRTAAAGSWSWLVFVAACTAVGVAAVWFISLQLLVLRRFCVYCVIANAAALAAAALTLLSVPVSGPAAGATRIAIVVGAAGAMLLAILQMIIRPRMWQLIPSPPAPATESAPSLPDPAPIDPEPINAPAPAATAPPAPRLIPLLGDRMRLNAAGFPLLGSLAAKHVIADVMDYTCEYCRALHPMLSATMRAFGGDLAVMIVIAPLERACNPHVPLDDPRYVNSCAYARLALAVWRTNPALFEEFHHWLLLGPRVPSLHDARIKAMEMIGAHAAEEAMTAPPPRTLAENVEIYHMTGDGPLPRLLLPTGIMMGQVSSNEKLTELLRTQLQAIPSAPPLSPPVPPSTAGVFSARRIEQ